LSNEIISIDIGSKYTKIIVGNSSKVLSCDKELTPKGAVFKDGLQDINVLSDLIKSILKKRNVTTKDVSFVIRGRDIVIRHIEMPLMGIDKLDEAVVWEITQYLPELVSDYYIDYQITNITSFKSDKVYKLMVAAAPKKKIDKYVKLASLLELKVKAIDVAANSIARVFSGLYDYNKNLESIGILDIGAMSTSISILDKGSLFIEREIPIGVSQMAEAFASNFTEDPEKYHEKFITKFNLLKAEADYSAEGKVKLMFDNLMETLQKVTTFYRGGNYEKKLDYVLLLGAGCEVYGIEKYVKQSIGAEAKAFNSMEDLYLNMEVPYGFDPRFYSNCLGMLLRDKTHGLNLLPDNMKKSKSHMEISKKIAKAAIITALLVVFANAVIFGYYMYVKNINKDLEKKIASKSEVQKENIRLTKEKREYANYIDKVDLLTNSKEILSEKVYNLKNSKPEDVTFQSVVCNGVEYTISAVTANYESISAMTAMLQMSDEYRNCKIKDVKLKDQNYTFTIVIRGE